MDVSTFSAQNPAWNSTLKRARELQAALKSQGLSSNPRIYADKYIFGGYMIPEKDGQDNSDLPGWATMNWDGTTTLDGLGVPDDQPFDVNIWVAEAGDGQGQFMNVGEADIDMKNLSMSLKQVAGL